MGEVLIPPLVSRAMATPPPEDWRRFELTGPTMGTQWRVQIYAPADWDAARLTALIAAPLAQLVAEMSHWDPHSPLSRFAHAPAQSWVPLSLDTRLVLKAGLSLAEKTGGAFSPCLAKVIDDWGFGPSGPRTTPCVRGEETPSPDWRDLYVDAVTGSVFQPGGVALDLSAIAKGYGLDLVAKQLLRAELTSWCLQIGGEVRASGVKADGLPWWVDLGVPAQAQRAADRVALIGMGLATSATGHKAFLHRGQSYGHLIDPKIQSPVKGDVVQVSVLHGSVMWADGWATALCLLASNEALALAEQEGLSARIWVQRDGVCEPIDTKALKKW
ncbi:FAD:protein FMN transferase [Woodsholea maritima]|uniref:FAD:protein FMN transferase n=1 Tax=Woodsholea maritima TaxID=240237 RepID=UPI000375650F|nr:FAD:protein FMN transferase [Woodsholea maritima]